MNCKVGRFVEIHKIVDIADNWAAGKSAVRRMNFHRQAVPISWRSARNRHGLASPDTPGRPQPDEGIHDIVGRASEDASVRQRGVDGSR